jgi:RNA-directed DNA polymerase
MNKSNIKLPQKYNEWKCIPWKHVQLAVQKYQTRIYSITKDAAKAEAEAKTHEYRKAMRKVRKLQSLLTNSYNAKLLAVRRVTQDNTGKKTAGVDGIKGLKPKERLTLAASLKLPTKASPIRRVWIPKPCKTEKRPLGIPTIKDRALQTLVKMALEPEWEAKFEPNSYGFRPGRGAHDAMKAIMGGIQKKAKYVLDADIKKCFDKINHNVLLDKLKLTGKLRAQIKTWLKAGILDEGTLKFPEEGTPQGGIISPLLANVALHGLETRLKEHVSTKRLLYSGGGQLSKDRAANSLNVIRYADDFVIMHDRLDILLECKDITIGFLKELNLELNPTKTKITHTLSLSNTEKNKFGVEKPGFNFLGFTVRQFPSKYKSARVAGKNIGYYTVIVPSKEKIVAHTRKLSALIRKNNNLSPEKLINYLNPLIRGWRNYFGVSNALQVGILQKLDHLLYLKLRAWSKKKGKVKKEGWKKVGGRNWVFGPINKKLQLSTYAEHDTSLNDYVKIQSDRSPYDGDEVYWATRLGKSPVFSLSQSKLLKAQKGRCSLCGLVFGDTDVLEIDHIIPKSQGGKKIRGNIQLMHRHCHDVKSAKYSDSNSNDNSIVSE